MSIETEANLMYNLEWKIYNIKWGKTMIAIGSDHRGYKLKEAIKEYLEGQGIKVIDFGADSEERVDSLPIAKSVCKSVQSGEAERGILICGTGLAMTIIANKFKRIMCTLCNDELSATRSKEHNDSNLLSMGAEMMDSDKAIKIVKAWIETEHLGGVYAERVNRIKQLEDENMK